MRIAGAERLEQPVDGAAGRVDGDARGNLEFPSVDPVAGSHADGSATVRDQRNGVDVIGENGAVPGGGEREGERQPIGLGRHVVVPHRGAGHAAPMQARKAPERVARHHASTGQLVRWNDVSIAIERDEPVQQESGAHGRDASGERP